MLICRINAACTKFTWKSSCCVFSFVLCLFKLWLVSDHQWHPDMWLGFPFFNLLWFLFFFLKITMPLCFQNQIEGLSPWTGTTQMYGRRRPSGQASYHPTDPLIYIDQPRVLWIVHLWGRLKVWGSQWAKTEHCIRCWVLAQAVLTVGAAAALPWLIPDGPGCPWRV